MLQTVKAHLDCYFIFGGKLATYELLPDPKQSNPHPRHVFLYMKHYAVIYAQVSKSSGFSTNNLYALCISLVSATRPAHPIVRK
jgi:hypothetical protein